MENLSSLITTLLAPETLEADRSALFLGLVDMPITADLVEQVADALTERMVPVHLPGVEMDTCGTGGSGKQRINTSTMVAFILAACGVKVGKHGNKAATGRCGCFDLLAAIGVKIDLTPLQEEKIYAETGLAFLFAPLHHPSLKYIAPLRKAYGKRTIFNLLGPLLSPANVPRQLLGTSDIATAEILAKVLQKQHKYGSKIVVGSDGLDEVTVTGPTIIFTISKELQSEEWDPSMVGFSTFNEKEIEGGSIEKNMEIFHDVLQCNGVPAHTALVLCNAAHALHIARPNISLSDCLLTVREAIESKRVYKLFESYLALSHRI